LICCICTTGVFDLRPFDLASIFDLDKNEKCMAFLSSLFQQVSDMIEITVVCHSLKMRPRRRPPTIRSMYGPFENEWD
jgi:hypothetical protein